MRISDWSSDVCSSDLTATELVNFARQLFFIAFPQEIDISNDQSLGLPIKHQRTHIGDQPGRTHAHFDLTANLPGHRYAMIGILRELLQSGRINQHLRSEEHTSELQSLMRISYAVFCLKKKKK